MFKNNLYAEIHDNIQVELKNLHLDPPKIDQVWIPKPKSIDAQNYAHFGLVKLRSGHAGIFYTNLLESIKNKKSFSDITKYSNLSSLPFLKSWIQATNFEEKMIGLGCSNALSQFIMDHQNPDPRKYNLNSFTQMKLHKKDHIGMVGFFTPLAAKLKEQHIKFTVVEKKTELVQQGEGWKVTLDPSSLGECNKIIITATSIINQTLDEILQYCPLNAWKMIIGPSAGILPAPLFHRGINLVGGTKIINSRELMQSIEQGTKWGTSVKKYSLLPSIN